MNDPRCKCPMAISMTGDGCRYCQPQDHIDRMGEWMDEEREEIDRLQAENEALRARVAGLVEALEDIGASWHRAGTRLEKYLQARARNALTNQRAGDKH